MRDKFTAMRLPVVTMVFIVVSSILTNTDCHAAPKNPSRDQQLAQVTKRYLTLKNTDPGARREREWELVADDLTQFGRMFADHPGAPAALFDSAIVFEHLYLSTRSRDQREHAQALLRELVKRYPRAALADDALIRLAQLLSDDPDNGKSEAEQVYRQVLERFPSTDSAIVARFQLAAINRIPVSPAFNSAQQSVLTRKNLGRTIVIDPGHGGEDSGAIGQGGLLEKDVTLDVARQLKTLLEERLAVNVLLSRSSDSFIALADRTRFANEKNATLFVSLHNNASPAARLNGLEVYYLDNTNDEASKTLAERENASHGNDGPAGDLQLMLSDLIQSSKLDSSVVLAHSVHAALLQRLSANWGPIGSYGVKKGPFFVLVGAHMPCILVEMLFIDHEQEGKLLGRKEFRHDLAEGIFQGIAAYLVAQN